MRLLKCSILIFILYSNLYSAVSIEVLFSPTDNVREKLIYLIDNAKDKIYAAIFMLTDKLISEAIIRAKKRGLDVQVISDYGCAKSSVGKMDFLADGGVEIFVFKPSKKDSSNTKFFNADPIMHNKFAIIDRKVWTGSFNWTYAANHKNHENVVIVSDEDNVINKFLRQFDCLKGYCARAQYPKKNSENKLPSKAIQMQIYDFLKDIKFKFEKYQKPLTYSKPKLKLRNFRGRQVQNKQKRG